MAIGQAIKMVRPKAASTSHSAPTGGLNDRDSLADMKPNYAIVLDNWWPLPSYVRVRKGSQNHVTGFASPVETLAEYFPASGSGKLFAAAGGSIFDVTSPGAVGSSVQTGLTNARWETCNLTTPGGSFMYMVNGADAPRLFNGTTWVAVNNVSSPAITGVSTSTFAHVCLFKNRLFFTQINSMNVWYLPVQSVGGAALLLDFGSVFPKGGSIQGCFTWTIDSGSGSDDHFVVLSTQGEVAVYEGTDPSSANNWRLVGVYSLGKPIGRRCATKFGGDLLINTTEGLFPLGKALLSSSINRSVALSDKIQNSISEVTTLYGSNHGWAVTLHSDANMILLNVPVGVGQNFQYALNTISGAWSKFTGWRANHWVSASSGLYYCSDNAVVKAWVGDSDNGVGIQADALSAFSYFGQKARNKFFTLIRPNLQTNGSPSVEYGINIDFTQQTPSGTLSFIPPTGMVWGTMTWGAMTWGGGLTDISDWDTVGEVGNSGAIRLRVLNNGSMVNWSGTDYLFEVGGIL